MGTGWGALSETHDFLGRLFDTDEQFPSPTDFVGSVHNSSASQIAIYFQATGPNLTASAGNYSFEQALMTASLAAPAGDGPFFVLAADEYHPHLSPLFEPASSAECPAADGGGALCLQYGFAASGLTISNSFFRRDDNTEQVIAALIHALGGEAAIQADYGMLLAGIPAACRGRATEQLKAFLAQSGFAAPVVDYRRLTGEFASASAVAAVMAIHWLQQGCIPPSLNGGDNSTLTQKKALIIGFGPYVTSMEITAP